MGLRYRKSINLGPLRLNLSKSGVGYSYGVKGYRVTHTANGKVRTTVSIPGTGISHVSEKPAAAPQRSRQTAAPAQREKSGMSIGVKLGLAALALFFVFIALAGCSAEEPAPTEPMSVQEAIAMVEGTRAPTEPTPAPTPEADPEPAPKPEPTEPKPEPTQPKPEPTEPAPTVPEPVPTEPEPAPTEPEPAPTVAYIGNKNSKKLHETWCDSVDKMKESNKVEFASREAAIGLGYEPCKNCNP